MLGQFWQFVLLFLLTLSISIASGVCAYAMAKVDRTNGPRQERARRDFDASLIVVIFFFALWVYAALSAVLR